MSLFAAIAISEPLPTRHQSRMAPAPTALIKEVEFWIPARIEKELPSFKCNYPNALAFVLVRLGATIDEMEERYEALRSHTRSIKNRLFAEPWNDQRTSYSLLHARVFSVLIEVISTLDTEVTQKIELAQSELLDFYNHIDVFVNKIMEDVQHQHLKPFSKVAMRNTNGILNYEFKVEGSRGVFLKGYVLRWGEVLSELKRKVKPTSPEFGTINQIKKLFESMTSFQNYYTQYLFYKGLIKHCSEQTPK